MQNHPKISLVSHETLEVVDTQVVLSNTSGIDMKLATNNTVRSGLLQRRLVFLS